MEDPRWGGSHNWSVGELRNKARNFERNTQNGEREKVTQRGQGSLKFGAIKTDETKKRRTTKEEAKEARE